MDPIVHLLNHQCHQKQDSCPKHPTLSYRRGTQGIHKWWTPRLWPHRKLNNVTFWSLVQCAIPCKHTIIWCSGVQVQDDYQHWIGPIHQRTPSQFHKDNIQEIRGRSILFWNNKRGLFQRLKNRLHITQNHRDQQVMFSRKINQSNVRSNNTIATQRMAVCTKP